MGTPVTFTKFHLEAIAATIRKMPFSTADTGVKKSIAIDFADMLQDGNPLFDRERFMKACGL